MAEWRRFLSIAVLIISNLVYAQSNSTKAPGGGSEAASGNERADSTPSATNTQAFDEAEILTDTMGVDFGPYLSQVVKKVKQNWYGVMPPSVYFPVGKQGKVAIEFFIQKDGGLKKMKLDTPPGDVALDRAAWVSITTSGRFAALPAEFPGQELGLRFCFYYNPGVITISPAVVVRIAAGSTQQFSVLGKDRRGASVTWRVSGLGCSKSACGTISDDGLYTAPANLPNPPTVFIEATARTGTTLPARVHLTVVQDTSSH